MTKSYNKHELAEMADVSYSSFYRFLCSHEEELSKLGYNTNAQKLRGKVLEYVCKEYDIDLPEEKPHKKHVKFE